MEPPTPKPAPLKSLIWRTNARGNLRTLISDLHVAILHHRYTKTQARVREWDEARV